jgi:Protein of unknown function (DUF1569)
MYRSSLFNAQDHATLIARINALTPSSQAVWGKMNVAQMLAHCQVPLRLMVGDTKLKATWFNLLIGKIVKGRVLGEGEFGKNSPTFKEAVIADERSFERERTQLISLLERSVNSGMAVITKDPHPFFGTMTTQEWDRLQSKHLNHHLQQFGV